jgi:hypothetical protein
MKIGIKRTLWFGYKWYDVDRYYFRTSAPAMNFEGQFVESHHRLWLVLKLTNGKDVVVTDIEARGYILPPVKSDLPASSGPIQPLDSEESI